MTQILPYVLEVGTKEVVLTPDPTHEFTATTEQVALGYGVSPEAIRSLKTRRDEELLEGKHWVAATGVAIRNAGELQRQQTLWTKRGIVRLGFFIRSKQARLFRDMAEDLVIDYFSKGQIQNPSPALITVRAIAESIGMTRGATLGRLSGMWRIPPVACGREQQPCYLFPLDAVAEALTGYQLHTPLRPYTGPILPGGLKPALEHARQGVLTRTGKNPRSHPLSIATPAPVTDRVQAAQELVQLEQRRAHLLSVLA
ncbi:hypothetical protein [Deinococcus sp. 12RED42]|uniref:hypothetical protein n=1 Tax=Deinococcus sp. 12RED42 TaxID=2745872 RepID=UPI001E49BD29|nr:hypothetical protein [Deinococcus sp. 12RED42]MCD0164456.1 hypothetical protein [Deinococcus sp. 12RED42]